MRRWALQTLLAPFRLILFDGEWKDVSKKQNPLAEISRSQESELNM